MLSLFAPVLTKIAPFFSKVAIYALAALGVVGLVVVIMITIRHLEAQNADLRAQVAVTRQTLDQVQAAVAEQQQAIIAYSQVQQRASNNVRRLTDVYQRHDLKKLGKAHPELVGRALNDGTARYQRMLECATGGSCPADPSAPASGATSR